MLSSKQTKNHKSTFFQSPLVLPLEHLHLNLFVIAKKITSIKASKISLGFWKNKLIKNNMDETIILSVVK